MTAKTTSEVLQSTRRMLEEGDCETAIAELDAALVDFPDEGQLWDRLGVALWDAGTAHESVDALEHATTLVPLSPEGQLVLALGYEVLQKRELSTELLIRLASRDPLPVRVLEQLARALGRAGEDSVALHVCQRAQRALPEAAAPLLGIAYYMARLGASSQQMLPALFSALHLDPENSAVRILLARRLHDCGLHEDAAEVLRLVDFSKCDCRNCLQAMHEIFQSAGDVALAAECKQLVGNLANH